MSMTGRIHSFQSMGTVDGPGLRSVVFMQGCPLRCICCHNPDTWGMEAEKEVSVEEISKKILRFRNYFADNGGVTVSGGEPLLQTLFVTELFKTLKEYDIHTALDTSGFCYDENVEQLLGYTDLVLLDLKYATDEEYKKNVGCSRKNVEHFLDKLEERKVPTWIRRVIIPGVNDKEEQNADLKNLKETYSCVQKIELLPFRKLCLEKYKTMGIPFSLENTPEATEERIQSLICYVRS